MRITTFAILAALSCSPSFATIIQFSGTVDYHSNLEVFPEDFFPDTFMGYVDYDATATSDKAAVQNIFLFLGDSYFIRTPLQTQSQAVTKVGPHSLTYLDPSAGGEHLAGHPGAYINQIDLAFYWPDQSSSFDRQSIDFSKVIGGYFHLALADGTQGLGVWGTITSVSAVPEPPTFLLFGVGIVGAAVLRRRTANS